MSSSRNRTRSSGGTEAVDEDPTTLKFHGLFAFPGATVPLLVKLYTNPDAAAKFIHFIESYNLLCKFSI